MIMVETSQSIQMKANNQVTPYVFIRVSANTMNHESSRLLHIYVGHKELAIYFRNKKGIYFV